jgi:hypothetical protein
MEQSPCEADSMLIREIARLLWKSKVHYRVRKLRPPFHILSQLIQSTPFQTSSLRSILILFSHLCRCLASSLFPSGFPTKIVYVFLMSPIRSTCHAHLILLDLIILIIFCEEEERNNYCDCKAGRVQYPNSG